MDDRALPSADPSLLPAVRERGGALGQQFVDVFVGFRLRFQDESEAGAFARHFRFASSRSALRQEGGGVVWVGFHGWAFDAADAQTQAALAVRHSALRARIRHIPAATDAELRPTDRRLVDVAKARREREELLARISEEVPDNMIDANRLALGAGARRISSGQRQAPTGQRASTPPPSSGPPPGAASGSSAAKPAKGRRRLFGR
ncbi:MAG: hypothetical protein JWR30_2820 [Conexibacter sp.]|nr:hypothetical protein [Conexibacter sp.]